MYTCSALLSAIIPQVIILFISLLMGECKDSLSGKSTPTATVDTNDCPFIETLSFGSEINIQCNSSYLVFNEINSEKFNWKFANQTSICKQNGMQQAHVNQCGVKRLNLTYLTVALVSTDLREKACVYCRINYKPIAPLISVTQLVHPQGNLYTVNITATALAQNESFEILSAKRRHDENRDSLNYWFLLKCIHDSVKIRENTAHTILFIVDDSTLSRVEFIIRRCHNTCRNYDTCHGDDFDDEIAVNYLSTPDSIEKLICDSDCLAGVISSPRSTPTLLSSQVSSSPIPSTDRTPFNEESKTIVIIVLSISGLLLTIPLVILLIYSLCQRRKRNMYAKASNVDPDETK